MADALDGDYSRSRAVLIGTWNYTELEPVPAARHSVERMRALLSGPLCRWPAERIYSVLNRSEPDRLPRELVENFRDVTDVALFYFVGHGLYDAEDRLCLALGDTTRDPALRWTTSLTFDSVRHAFKMSRAATKIAILDCCFAGLAAERAGRLSTDTTELPPSPGSYLMMASPADSTAWFQQDATDSPQTYFTKYLIDVIDRGIPGQPEGLRLGPIFDVAADLLVADGKPEPGRHAVDHATHFVFARNAAPPQAAATHTKTQRGRDIEAATTVPFHTAFRGAVVPVRVPSPCETCQGSGAYDGHECQTCRGIGEVDQGRTTTAVLPPGTVDGQRIRIAGQGWPGPDGGPPGDLTVTVHVEADPTFDRTGHDLTARLPLSHTERRDGTTVSLKAPGGWVGVRVPKDSSFGDVVTIPGRGVPRADGTAGDLHVSIESAAPRDEVADRTLANSIQKIKAPTPQTSGPRTTYRWALPRHLAYAALLLAVIALAGGLCALALWLLHDLPSWVIRLVFPGVMFAIAGIVIRYGRRLSPWRRPPLVLTDDGITHRSFGYISWSDVAGVQPNNPQKRWITVVLRRTATLSTGHPNPLRVPIITLSDLRGRPKTVPDDMKRHCPS